MATPPDAKEIELIKKLRENLADLDLCEEVLCNINLVRWLRARNHVLKDAEEMYRDYIKWSDDVNLESIFSHEISDIVADGMRHSMCGLDYGGSPICLSLLGQMDLPKLFSDGYKEQIHILSIQLLERNAYLVRQMMAKQPENEKKFIQIPVIADSEGLRWRHFASADAVHLLVEQAKTIELRYPETVKKMIIINAPRIFTLAWTIVKPFISAKTMEKIEIYGTNREEWQEALYKLAPKESLPKKYGGILPDDVDILPKSHECVPKKRGGY